MITTLTLNPALDLFLEVKDFDPDDSNRVIHFYREPGGKGINVSRVIKALGGLTTALGPLGGAEGEEFKKLLHEEDIYIWSVNTQSRTRENIAIMSQTQKGQTRFNMRGGVLAQNEYREFLKLLDQLADNADVFVISGSLPPGISEDAYYKIIKMVQAANPRCKIFLDADGVELEKGIRAIPTLIKPNIHELERLVGKKLKNQKAIIQAVQKLQKKYPIPYMVVSLGAKGLLGFDLKGRVYAVAAPRVPVVTTLGAGDALLGGIAQVLRKSQNFEEALCYGVAVSNAKIQCHRFCEIKTARVKALFKKIKIQKVKV